MMMGFWFAATLPGDILAGFLGGFWSTMAKPDFFLMIPLFTGIVPSAGLTISNDTCASRPNASTFVVGELLSPP